MPIVKTTMKKLARSAGSALALASIGILTAVLPSPALSLSSAVQTSEQTTEQTKTKRLNAWFNEIF